MRVSNSTIIVTSTPLPIMITSLCSLCALSLSILLSVSVAVNDCCFQIVLGLVVTFSIELLTNQRCLVMSVCPLLVSLLSISLIRITPERFSIRSLCIILVCIMRAIIVPVLSVAVYYSILSLSCSSILYSNLPLFDEWILVCILSAE